MKKDNIIEMIRRELCMSRQEFARALKITSGAVSNYEYGARKPTSEIAYRILDLANKNGLKYTLEDIYVRKIFGTGQ